MKIGIRPLVAILLATIVAAFFVSAAYGLGNHPESSVCNHERPYQAICTHSLHNLEGWYGKCYTEQDLAQKDADEHANKQHDGNSRYTGIKKALENQPAGY